MNVEKLAILLFYSLMLCMVICSTILRVVNGERQPVAVVDVVTAATQSQPQPPQPIPTPHPAQCRVIGFVASDVSRCWFATDMLHFRMTAFSEVLIMRINCSTIQPPGTAEAVCNSPDCEARVYGCCAVNDFILYRSVCEGEVVSVYYGVDTSETALKRIHTFLRDDPVTGVLDPTVWYLTE